MDYITKFRRQLALRSFIAITVPVCITAFAWITFTGLFEFSTGLSILLTGILSIISVFLATIILVGYGAEPIETMEQVIGYAAHNNRNVAQPNIDTLRIGRELITAQSLLIYDLASSSSVLNNESSQINTVNTNQPVVSGLSMLDAVATPIFGVDSNSMITVANKSAAEYIGKPVADMLGKPIYDCLNLSFQGDKTYQTWLEKTRTTSVTATRSWDRVRHIIDEDHSKQFDLVASFSSGNKSGTESMLALFDKTEKYNNDDQDVSFVALAVHELRTPLTIMRGYIEVFEDELGPTLTPELTEFMHKMHASAQQLAAFVSNILNVARIEENQLSLKLRSENWEEILKNAVEDLELRAQVHGKHIVLQIADNLPPVAADRISAHEVINNLVDNAIKYSGSAEKIVITTSLNSDGLIETGVQDFGIGIPESVMSGLFQKYHRSHKSNMQVLGTGLGLYLCKALVTAHGGNIWVRSKEGEGSIFSFTLLPYDQISSEQIDGEDGIIRGAHGWIKNHSLYRN
jgi:signal transduction histidine kinase